MKPSPDQINQHFTNHKQAMKCVKPMVECFRKQDLRVSRNNKKEQLNYHQFDLVHKMFKSVNKQKGTVDNAPPSTSNIKKIFKDKHKKNRLDVFQAQEHQRQLKSIKQRIDNCGNIEQRKKRNYDPITHPTYLMRNPSQGPNEISIEPFAKTVLNMNQPKLVRPVSAVPQYQKMTEVASKHVTAKHQQSSQDVNEDTQHGVGLNHGTANLTKTVKPSTYKRPQSAKPPVVKDIPFPQCNFKSIMNYLIDKRLFRDLDLKVLYERLCYRYNEQTVQPIWLEVTAQLQQ